MNRISEPKPASVCMDPVFIVQSLHLLCQHGPRDSCRIGNDSMRERLSQFVNATSVMLILISSFVRVQYILAGWRPCARGLHRVVSRMLGRQKGRVFRALPGSQPYCRSTLSLYILSRIHGRGGYFLIQTAGMASRSGVALASAVLLMLALSIAGLNYPLLIVFCELGSSLCKCVYEKWYRVGLEVVCVADFV